MNRMEIPVQPIARKKTTDKTAESIPVPVWMKERNKMVKEAIENERSNVSNEIK